ncbi:MAG: hypothetical protein ACRDRW_11090 [Pseudonocardiaceae bacterium]
MGAGAGSAAGGNRGAGGDTGEVDPAGGDEPHPAIRAAARTVTEIQ